MRFRQQHNSANLRNAPYELLYLLSYGHTVRFASLGGGSCHQGRTDKGCYVGRYNMALRMKMAKSRQQCGMSLIELLIAIAVLTIGVAGCAVVIPIAIGRNFANRQQSNSTAIAQMVLEKLMSVQASASPTLTITDCASNANTVSTTGSAGGSGSTVMSSGEIDFSVAQGSGGAPAGYYMDYTTCGTNGRQSTYDVRWNIKAPSTFAEVITVSAKLKKTTNDAKMFSRPVTIRSISGQGS